jgi:hypothetical protein
VVALHEIAADAAQRLVGRVVLDTVGDDAEAQAVSQLDRRVHQSPVAVLDGMALTKERSISSTSTGRG